MTRERYSVALCAGRRMPGAQRVYAVRDAHASGRAVAYRDTLADAETLAAQLERMPDPPKRSARRLHILRPGSDVWTYCGTTRPLRPLSAQDLETAVTCERCAWNLRAALRRDGRS